MSPLKALDPGSSDVESIHKLKIWVMPETSSKFYKIVRAVAIYGNPLIYILLTSIFLLSSLFAY